MSKVKKTEQYFWIFLLTAVFAGFTAPHLFVPYEHYIVPIIMTIMGILYLKVDLIDVITHIRRPYLLIYVTFIKLILLPTIVFFLFRSFDQNLLMGLFLLAALPTGISSAVFTDIMQGRTSLNLTIVIITNLISIFTIPLLYYVFFETSLNFNHKDLFLNLLYIIFVPFIAAKMIKRVFLQEVTQKLQRFYNLGIIILLSLMIAIAISFQAEYILQTLPSQIKTVGILFVTFILFQMIGYFGSFWRTKGEKLAISNSTMIMNNILGIVLALAFFNKEVVTVILLSLIPWNAMIIAKHWYKRYLP